MLNHLAPVTFDREYESTTAPQSLLPAPLTHAPSAPAGLSCYSSSILFLLLKNLQFDDIWSDCVLWGTVERGGLFREAEGESESESSKVQRQSSIPLIEYGKYVK